MFVTIFTLYTFRIPNVNISINPQLAQGITRRTTVYSNLHNERQEWTYGQITCGRGKTPNDVDVRRLS